MEENNLETDLLIIGGGIGGMSAAAEAASRGASVVVVEIGKDIGGSAILSQGLVWMPPTMQGFVAEDSQGDVAQFQALLDDFSCVFEWLESHDVWISPPVRAILGLGDGRQVDMAGFFAAMLRVVEGVGGVVVRNTETEELIIENGAVLGARCRDIESGERVIVRAKATVLATGGFQASEEARRRYLPNSTRLILRGNPNNTGGGIKFGISAGGSLSEPMGGFYGHLLPYPGDEFKPSDFARLSFYESEFGVLIDKSGERFCDKSLGDHINVQEVSEVDRAVLVVDEDVRVNGLGRLMAGADGSEKWAAAAGFGCNYVQAATFEELCEAIAQWGYSGQIALKTLKAFNAVVESNPNSLDPPRFKNRRAIAQPPFHAVEVQAGITFAYGGLRSDAHGRVLDRNGNPVPKLFVAGVDAGGFNRKGYGGGLVRGLVFGRRAAAAAMQA